MGFWLFLFSNWNPFTFEIRVKSQKNKCEI